MKDNFKIHSSILVPKETSDSLVDALRAAAQYGSRVTINYGDPLSGDCWHHETGYIRKQPVRDDVSVLVLAPYLNSEHGGQIEIDSVVSVEHANRKTGTHIWPSQNMALFSNE